MSFRYKNEISFFKKKKNLEFVAPEALKVLCHQIL